MRLLFLGLLLLCINSLGDEKESKTVREMRSAGFIVVFDSENRPVEVQIESAGDTIVCYSQQYKDSQFFTVRKEMFKRGQFSILIYCTKGELSFKQGYI